MKNFENQDIFLKAKKRMIAERSFYVHLVIYIICNVIISLLIIELKDYIYKGFLTLNLLSTPVLWGLFLVFHYLLAFKNKSIKNKLSHFSIFSKKWEKQKIEEIMKEDDF